MKVKKEGFQSKRVMARKRGQTRKKERIKPQSVTIEDPGVRVHKSKTLEVESQSWRKCRRDRGEKKCPGIWDPPFVARKH